MSGTTVCPHVALYLPNLHGGGAERAFVELAKEFVALGVRVDLVLSHRSGPYVDEVPRAIRILDLGTRRRIRSLVRLAGYLKHERPDVLLAGGDVSNAVALLASVVAGVRERCVIGQRSMMRPVWRIQRPVTWLLWFWVLRALYARSRIVICNSTAAYAEMINDVGIPETRCAVIHNGVDVERIQRLAQEEADDPWFASPARPLLISVGSLIPVKDMATVLHAFALVQRSHASNLLILGEGEERSRLESLASELGIVHVMQMPGFVKNPFSWISRARVLISASLTEGCPNVIQQALACNTSIVATDCPGGTAEILEHGKWGRLVPMRDPEAMASAIVATLEDPDPPDGRLRAADFDSRRCAEEYLRLLLPGFRPQGIPKGPR